MKVVHLWKNKKLNYKYCGEVLSQEIYQLKCHLTRIPKDVETCILFLEMLKKE